MVVKHLCECVEDGPCPKYRREMSGRMREICAGVNVDLGTAAAFREQWAHDAVVLPSGDREKLLLRTGQAAGDAVAMTAAIWSLHLAHPGRYETSVESLWPEVFDHNPDVVSSELLAPDRKQPDGIAVVEMHYPAVRLSNERGIHFMQGWCEFLGAALGIDVPLLTNRPHLYFDPYDYDLDMVGDYWVVCSGGKSDFTTKLWGHENYQRVMWLLQGEVQFVQAGRAEDDHPRLSGAEDMVGMTNLRQLFQLVRRARGVLCGVSLLMHVAAALEKPAVVVAGGREPVPWNAYPRQQYVHTVGALPCSDAQGKIGGACWRYRTVPLGDETSLDDNTCLYPVDGTPRCMRMIKPIDVATQILRYDAQYRNSRNILEVGR